MQLRSQCFFVIFCCFAVLSNIELLAQKRTKQSYPQKEYINTQNQINNYDTSKVIATINLPLTKTLPESNLGNLITDAFLWYGQQKNPKVVAAFIPYSSIKTDYIAPGEITIGTIKTILPQKSSLVITSLTGKQINELCQSLATKGGGCVAGINFTIHNKNAIDIIINEATLHPNIYYEIVLPEFLLKNENYYAYLYNSSYTKLYVHLCDAVIKFIENNTQNGNEIATKIQERIKYVLD